MNPTNHVLPAVVAEERLRFLSACKASRSGRLHVVSVARAVDDLIQWSLANEELVEFSSSEELQQKCLGFVKRRDGNLIWEAYPDSKKTLAKVCVFTRAYLYLPPEVVAVLRERFGTELNTDAKGEYRDVIGIAAKSLDTSARRLGLRQFLDWASRDPRFAASR